MKLFFVVSFSDTVILNLFPLMCDFVNDVESVFEPYCEKPVFRVFDLVPHKPSCTAIEDVLRLEISDLGSRGIVLSV